MPSIGSLVDDTVEKRISELEDMSVETFQMENRKRQGKKPRIVKNNYERCKVCVMGILEGEKSSFNI